MRVPFAGSTPLADSVTVVKLATGLAGLELALTDGVAAPGGGAIGTLTVAVSGVVVFPPPTVTWKVRFLFAATAGALNVEVIALEVESVTAGSPLFTICFQAYGPSLGVLPAAVKVTCVPATIGLAAAV